MNNKKGTQPNAPVNDQDLSNKNIDSLKEFNSTPIDTPTPVSLSDNLEPSKSLTQESLLAEEPKPELTLETQVPSEPQVEPLLESEVKDTLISEPEPEIKLESVTEPSYETKIKLDQDSEVIPLSEVEPQPQPKPEVELKSEPDIDPKLDNEYTTDPMPTVQAETNPPEPVSQDPEEIKQKIEEVLSYNSASSVVNSQPDKPKTSGFLKTLFTFSLITFIAITGGLAYFIFNPSLKTSPETKTTPTDTPVQSNVTCELNGFIYTLNQSFPSADGCNTCTCVSVDNIACTEKACADVTTTPATKSATNLSVTPGVSLSTNNLKIVDLEFDLPKNWSIVSVNKNEESTSTQEIYDAKLLTDYKPYKVHVLIRVSKYSDKNSERFKEINCASYGLITINQGKICEIAGSGLGWIGFNLINGNNYLMSWDLESNQPIPTDLGGVWVPDHNITDDLIINFSKSVKIINP